MDRPRLTFSPFHSFTFLPANLLPLNVGFDEPEQLVDGAGDAGE